MNFRRWLLLGWLGMTLAGLRAAETIPVRSATGGPGGAADLPSAPLRVMSFNVRNSKAPDAANVWSNRSEIFFGTVARFQPDLVGFQEVLADQYDAIVARLPGYAFEGVARNDGKRDGEWAMVGYLRERFVKVAGGDFWLSEQPDVPGSKSWDAALTRLCSWVRLREAATGRELVFANTHFDHKGVVSRQHASRLLSARLSSIAGAWPAVLVGDFNITEDDPAYAVLVRPEVPGALRWTDAFRSVYPQRGAEEATFHGFQGTVIGSRIDFVFHSDHFRATSAGIDRTGAPEKRYPSDHYPVTAVLVTK